MIATDAREVLAVLRRIVERVRDRELPVGESEISATERSPGQLHVAGELKRHSMMLSRQLEKLLAENARLLQLGPHDAHRYESPQGADLARRIPRP
ncbi:MAG: hypothetical protein ACREI7_07935 [Myxococcota bacterium]